jgi:hypothetical protein
LLVVVRVSDLRNHDQQGLGIDQRLGVVALFEAASGKRPDAGLLIREG